MNRIKDERETLTRVIEVQSEIAAANLGLADVMRVVTARSQELMGADGAVLELAEGDEMVYRAVSGTAEGTLGLRLKRVGSLSGLCVETGEVLLCLDSERDERVDREACRRVGLRSMIAVPLEYRGSALGVLKVMHAVPGAFAQEDAQVLRLLAGLIGSSLAHARTFESTSTQAAEFAHLATHDSMTGLANRALVYDRLRFLSAHEVRTGNSHGLLLLDINAFKAINDTHGHLVGDDVIRWVAGRLRDGVREADLAARLGGDEFVVVLAPPLDEERLAIALERIAALTCGTAELGGQRLSITTSVGGSLSSEAGVVDVDTLMEAADRRMYEAKTIRRAQTG